MSPSQPYQPHCPTTHSLQPTAPPSPVPHSSHSPSIDCPLPCSVPSTLQQQLLLPLLLCLEEQLAVDRETHRVRGLCRYCCGGSCLPVRRASLVRRRSAPRLAPPVVHIAQRKLYNKHASLVLRRRSAPCLALPVVHIAQRTLHNKSMQAWFCGGGQLPVLPKLSCTLCKRHYDKGERAWCCGGGQLPVFPRLSCTLHK